MTLSNPSHLPKAPPLNTIPLRRGLQKQSLGDTDMQSLTLLSPWHPGLQLPKLLSVPCTHHAPTMHPLRTHHAPTTHPPHLGTSVSAISIATNALPRLAPWLTGDRRTVLSWPSGSGQVPSRAVPLSPRHLTLLLLTRAVLLTTWHAPKGEACVWLAHCCALLSQCLARGHT